MKHDVGRLVTSVRTNGCCVEVVEVAGCSQPSIVNSLASRTSVDLAISIEELEMYADNALRRAFSSTAYKITSHNKKVSK